MHAHENYMTLLLLMLGGSAGFQGHFFTQKGHFQVN